MTLLRVVGHVLDKVDAETSPNAQRAIAAAWDELSRSKPEPTIFWGFIDAERNNVVKAYEFGVALNITLRPGTGRLSLSTGDESWSPGPPATFEAFVRSGPFKGRDPLQLCREALDFWAKYLDDIDHRIAEQDHRPV